MKTELLLELLDYVHKNFPAVERIAAYGTAKDVLKKSEEDLKALAAAGLELIYLGAESGDDRVLEHIKKDVKAADIIAAGQKLKRCGLQTSVTLISAWGGRKGIRDHAIKSAELITGMNPEYASFLTLRLYEGTEMNEEVKRGDMELITPDEIVEEMELFLKNVDSPGTVFRTNHASNYVVLAGNLNEDIPRMLGELEGGKGRAEIPSGGVAETYLKDRGACWEKGGGRLETLCRSPGRYRLKTGGLGRCVFFKDHGSRGVCDHVPAQLRIILQTADDIIAEGLGAVVHGDHDPGLYRLHQALAGPASMV